jgi:hypothetical protein
MKLEIVTENNDTIQLPKEGNLSTGILAKLIGLDESLILQVVKKNNIPTSPGTQRSPDRPPSTKFQVKDFPTLIAGLQKALKETNEQYQTTPQNTVNTEVDFQIMLPDKKSKILFLYEGDRT